MLKTFDWFKSEEEAKFGENIIVVDIVFQSVIQVLWKCPTILARIVV